ncbi:MAG: hypothetical protein ACP5P4_16660 [Steroidobacteraceae bacterium]
MAESLELSINARRHFAVQPVDSPDAPGVSAGGQSDSAIARDVRQNRQVWRPGKYQAVSAQIRLALRLRIF